MGGTADQRARPPARVLQRLRVGGHGNALGRLAKVEIAAQGLVRRRKRERLARVDDELGPRAERLERRGTLDERVQVDVDALS